jgi:hypothetical protein
VGNRPPIVREKEKTLGCKVLKLLRTTNEISLSPRLSCLELITDFLSFLGEHCTIFFNTTCELLVFAKSHKSSFQQTRHPHLLAIRIGKREALLFIFDEAVRSVYAIPAWGCWIPTIVLSLSLPVTNHAQVKLQ